MNNEINVGIEKISLYIPRQYVDLHDLAIKRGVDPNKWTKGIGQEKMSVITKDQDIVTMAANAANNILEDKDKEKIDQIIFATESGIDYSKASSIYLKELLNINRFSKAYELKQACYSLTQALQIAYDYIRLRNDRKVLIVSSDISKYGAKTAGEVTQGAGAIAMLISSNPKIAIINDESISLTRNEFDFYRPSYEEYPIVDGKFSTQLYIDMFNELLDEYEKRYDNLEDLESILFHLPFSKMGKKVLLKYNENSNKEQLVSKWLERYDDATRLGKQVGNIYTGSLYLSLISSLMYSSDLDNKNLLLYSYGSGAVAELLNIRVCENYKEYLDIKYINNLFENRQKLDLDNYDNEYFKNTYTSNQDQEFNLEINQINGFYIEKITNGKRIYKYK